MTLEHAAAAVNSSSTGAPPRNLGLFTELARLGYGKDLLHIARKGTLPSPFANINPDDFGKTPTLPTEDGPVGARGFTKWPDVSHETLARWHRLSNGIAYNVGFRTGDIHAVDVDADDSDLAATIYRYAVRCGMIQLGTRTGRPPRFLFPVILPTKRRKLRLVLVHQDTGAQAKVEVLAIGQQFVALGVHPVTGLEIAWYPGPNGRHLLNTSRQDAAAVTDVGFDYFWEGWASVLTGTPWAIVAASEPKANGHAAELPAVDKLAPDLAHIREALRWMPNGPGENRDRDEWVKVGMAVASATGKSGEGLDLWLEWCRQWSDDSAADHNAEKLWHSVDLEHTALGWRWLAERATVESVGRCTLSAELDFAADPEPDPEPEPDDLFTMPQSDKPSESEVTAAIEALEKGDKVAAVLQLVARLGEPLVDARRWLEQIKKRTGHPLSMLDKAYTKELAMVRSVGIADVGGRMAKMILSLMGKRLAWWQDQFWEYNGRFWESIPTEKVRAEIQRLAYADENLLADLEGKRKHMDSTATQALNILKGELYAKLQARDDPRFSLRPVINCANGTLYIGPNGERTFKPHDPADAFTNMVDIDYNPHAPAPQRYIATLSDMLSLTDYTVTLSDPDYAEVRAAVDNAKAIKDSPVTLADGRRVYAIGRTYYAVDLADNMRMVNEQFGYLLQPGRFARQVFFWWGNGSNGKSQMVKCFTQTFRHAVSAIDLENFSENPRFIWDAVRGKLVLFVEDMKRHTELPDSLVKTLSGNDLREAERKHDSNLKPFINTACLFALMNGLPSTSDLTDGLMERVVIQRFKRKFAQSEWHNDPWAVILADRREMSGVLNLWLDGLTSVLRNREVRRSRASIEAHEMWRLQSTPVNMFLEEYTMRARPVTSKADGEAAHNLFNAYRSWYATTQGNARFVLGLHAFNRLLRDMGLEQYLANGVTRWRGLWLRPDKVAYELGGITILGAEEIDPGEE